MAGGIFGEDPKGYKPFHLLVHDRLVFFTDSERSHKERAFVYHLNVNLEVWTFSNLISETKGLFVLDDHVHQDVFLRLSQTRGF